MLIGGDTYEYVHKIQFYPTLRVTRLIERYGKHLGGQVISVRYLVYMPPMPTKVSRMLADIDVKDYIARLALAAIRDRTNWKNPTEGAFETEDENTAVFLADLITHMVGGAWIVISPERKYYVWSKGYYHYIGA